MINWSHAMHGSFLLIYTFKGLEIPLNATDFQILFQFLNHDVKISNRNH